MPLISAQTGLTFVMDDVSGCVGDTVCMPLKVEHFDHLEGIGFVMSYDPTVMKFLSIKTFDTVLDGVNYNTTTAEKDGWFLILWTDLLGESVTLPDGSIILEVCYELIGESGDQTNMEIVYGADTYYLDRDVVGEQIMNYAPASVDMTSCADFDILLDWCSPTIGNADGSLTISACCNTAPYFFTITPAIGSVGAGSVGVDKEKVAINNVPPGTYTIEMRDVNGVTKFRTVTINEKPMMEILPFVTKDPTCWDKSNGKITIEGIVGGVAPYKVAWSNGLYNNNVFPADVSEISYLTSGHYVATISDVNGCEIVKETDIFKDTIYAVAELIDSASCEGVSDGVIKVTGSGGDKADGVGYYVNKEFFTPPAISQNIDAHAGWNIFYVSGDPQNCFSTLDSIYVPFKKVIHFKPIALNDIRCFGGTTKVIMGVENVDRIHTSYFEDVVTKERPTGAQSIQEFFADGVKAGTYDIFVEESNTGCTADTTIVINEPDSLYVMEVSTIQPTCVGNDGRIEVKGVGGTPGYTYTWNNNQTGTVNSGLGGGTHQVELKDANGCLDSLSIILNDAATFQVEIDTIEEIDCTNPNSGKLGGKVVSGGSGSFLFEWSTNMGIVDTAVTIENLIPTTYYLRAIDEIDGCVSFDTITLMGSSTMEIDSTINMPSCFNSNNGTVGLVISGGQTPYSIDWEGYPANKDNTALAGLTSGSYQVTIGDQSGCTVVRIIDLPAPDTIKASVEQIEPTKCFGENSGKAMAFGSNGNNGNNYGFTWSSAIDNALNTPSDAATHLYGGRQWVFVSDLNCASDTLFFDVDEPQKIMLTGIDMVQPSCAGECDGSITVTGVEGGVPNYTYQWNNGGASDMLSNICAGDQSLSIIDNNNCQVDTMITLSEPAPFVVTIDSANTIEISCQDANSGVIKVKDSGGNAGPKTYEWTNNVSTTDIATGLSVGHYFITVTDSKGCFDTTQWTFMAPSPVVGSIATIDPIDCYGGETCISVENISGGVGNYTFSINNSPNFSVDSCILVSAGEYNILIFDNAGCYDEHDITIDQPDKIELTISPEDNTYDLGDDPKVLDLTIDNNIVPIDSIIWTPLTALNCMDGDCMQVAVNPTENTTYIVEVIDENGCVAKMTKDIIVNSNRNVYFPNIFMPRSADEENSLFNFSLGNGVEIMDYLYIYDRWGNLVYQKENILPGNESDAAWDGTYNGRLLDPGVFVYMSAVHFVDGKEIRYKGSITIVR